MQDEGWVVTDLLHAGQPLTETLDQPQMCNGALQ